MRVEGLNSTIGMSFNVTRLRSSILRGGEMVGGLISTVDPEDQIGEAVEKLGSSVFAGELGNENASPARSPATTTPSGSKSSERSLGNWVINN